MQPHTPRSRWQAMLERPAQPRLKSPLARAVVPVLGGIAFFVVLGLVLWGIAAVKSGDGESFGRRFFEVGRVDVNADRIEKNGPLLYPDLANPKGKRSVIVDHTGDSDIDGWHLYTPYPKDRPGTACLATQVEKTRTFTDCEGRTLPVEDLQDATFLEYVVENGRTLIVRLRETGAVASTVPVSTIEA